MTVDVDDLAWRAVSRPRTVLLAAPRSYCAGVERAISIIDDLVPRKPIYVRKRIVNNKNVIADLETRGAIFVDELDEVPEGATVLFSAHGVSPSVRAEAAARKLDVIDATCPLVTKSHAEARRFASRGDTVILIGKAGHDEVEGTLGQAPGDTRLVQDVSDVAELEVRDPARVSYLTQTTLAADQTTEIVEALRLRFPALRGPSSTAVCHAATDRQDALAAMAVESDLVLVLGPMNSANSMRLVELAHRHRRPAHLIENAAAIRPAWLTGVRTIGLTAGASAPPRLVDGVLALLAELGPITVSEVEPAGETIHFGQPVSR